MVKFYVKNIIRGKMLWTNVPEYWVGDVKLELVKEGYILNDDGTVTKKTNE